MAKTHRLRMVRYMEVTVVNKNERSSETFYLVPGDVINVPDGYEKDLIDDGYATHSTCDMPSDRKARKLFRKLKNEFKYAVYMFFESQLPLEVFADSNYSIVRRKKPTAEYLEQRLGVYAW